eukprot:TRINITY_DN517_c1_g3_i1.p1 TRINITY_DN517_c1_g3~~TRINITY_DN517_c1_g3_i1.p1  ORF type:complete len:311 (-),score=46.34 TRINITY_DN517_c1_g3_i1:12-944(-)
MKLLPILTFAVSCLALDILSEPGPKTSSLWMAPNPLAWNGTLEGPLGGGNSSWFVVQWNNPTAIGGSGYSPGRGSCTMSQPVAWHIVNDNIRICASATTPSIIEFAQSGDNLQCGLEYDLFITPLGFQQKPYGTNWMNFAIEPVLGQLGEMIFSFGAELKYFNIAQRCGSFPQCGISGHVDYAYATAALVLSSIEGGQTLFVQIALWDSRGDQCGQSCHQQQEQWFFSTNPFGFNIGVGAMGGGCIGVNTGRIQFNLNVLPAIKEAIASGPGNMIRDPTKWKVGSLYIGTGMQGAADVVLLVDSINLTAQ